MFFKGRRCLRGHQSGRYVSSGCCKICVETIYLPKRYKANKENYIPRVARALCQHCGNSFEKTNNANKYCSTNCRFWPKVDKRGEDDCWPWLASLDGEGYGGFSNGTGKRVGAHQHAFEVGTGIIVTELKRKKFGDNYVCHTCDNRSCMNPKHLYLGTHDSNMKDMKDRGRIVGKTGKRKYDRKIVAKVKKLRKEGLTYIKIFHLTEVPSTVAGQMVRGEY